MVVVEAEVAVGGWRCGGRLCGVVVVGGYGGWLRWVVVVEVAVVGVEVCGYDGWLWLWWVVMVEVPVVGVEVCGIGGGCGCGG